MQECPYEKARKAVPRRVRGSNFLIRVICCEKPEYKKIGLCSAVFGIGPVVVFAMSVAVLVETFTGLRASHKRGEPFESYKFSRCIIKVAVWLTLVFILNSFARDMDARESWLYSVGSFFFDSAKLAVLTYFCVEYVTSILENLSVIDGKPKDALISAIKDKWSVMINLLKNKNEK